MFQDLYDIMNIFFTLSMWLHLFSAFSHGKKHPVNHGVFVIEDQEEDREGGKFETGWEGGTSWEENIDKMLQDSDDGDTSKKWEDLARSLRRTYQTWKPYKSDG